MIVLRKHFLGLEGSRQDEMITDTLAYLYDHIRLRKYDDDTPSVERFFTYFYTIIKRQLINTFNEIVSYERPKGCIKPARMLYPQDVENHIYLNQLPGYIRDLVVDSFRFDGLELQACMYVLDRLLNGSKIVVAYMKRMIGVKDPEFFISYVVVMIRKTIYEMKIASGRYRFNNVFVNAYEIEK
jgi:hypothetical protein